MSKVGEWSTGNGQCPDCLGMDPKQHRIGGFIAAPKDFGHRPDCRLAELARTNGGSPVMLGAYKGEPNFKFSLAQFKWLEVSKPTEEKV